MKFWHILAFGWIATFVLNDEIVGIVLTLVTFCYGIVAFAIAALREQEAQKQLAEEDGF